MATYWENSCSFGLRYVSWYKYLIVGLVFSHLGFWSGNLFLIAPFPDLCLLVPFYKQGLYTCYLQYFSPQNSKSHFYQRMRPKSGLKSHRPFGFQKERNCTIHEAKTSYSEADLRLCFRIGKNSGF